MAMPTYCGVVWVLVVWCATALVVWCVLCYCMHCGAVVVCWYAVQCIWCGATALLTLCQTYLATTPGRPSLPYPPHRALPYPALPRGALTARIPLYLPSVTAGGTVCDPKKSCPFFRERGYVLPNSG